MSMKRTLAALAVAATAVTSLIGGAGVAAAALNPGVSPGGNFDLSKWQLQLPIGSPGAPTTISPSQLKGASGFHDAYFQTSTTDGAMTFWCPENGVHTANSNFPRSELREMTASGSGAAWSIPGTHKLSATVKVTQVPNHVAVGQIHLDPSTGSNKPLLELFYHSNGNVDMAIEQSPAGGSLQSHVVGNVPLGQTWSYVITLSGGNKIGMTLNGKTTTFTMNSSFNGQKMYFKAGDYNQSSSTSSTKGSKVSFYALTFSHS
jgi:hypothetical protein